jgi:hypothetical protein
VKIAVVLNARYSQMATAKQKIIIKFINGGASIFK